MVNIQVKVSDSQGNQVTRDVEVSVSTIGRDIAKWPFHENSIWNMPIGSGAIFDSRAFWKPPAFTRDNFAVDPEPICLDPTAPPLPCYEFNRFNPNGTKGYWMNPLSVPAAELTLLPFSLRTPVNYFTRITDPSWDQNTPNAAGGALQTDGTTIREFNYGFRVEANKWRIGADRGTLQIRGDGLEFARGKLAWGGHGGSMLSGVGGSIRRGELFGPDPIRHAVKLTGDMKLFGLQLNGDNVHIWPAFTSDSSNMYGRLAIPGSVPMIPMGGLIAIPPSINLPSLGFETAPALKLAQAIQRFGCYLVDECGSDQWIQHLWCMEWGCVEEGLAQGVNFGGRDVGAFPNPWSRDSDKILYACRLVMNNTPTTIGGGGTPLYPKAPPLS